MKEVKKMDAGKMGKVKGKGMSSELAQQKHALSERKRRNRINCHYHSLRHLFPRLLKSDKASVLAETVHHLKYLKRLVADVGDPSFFIPGEKDEMTVTYVNNTTVQAIVCCEDRPGLNQELTQAIHSVRGKAVKAEMASIGGRTRTEVVVEWPECREEDVGLLRRALKAVVENRVLGYGSTTEPELIGFGRVCDQIEDGLIVTSY